MLSYGGAELGDDGGPGHVAVRGDAQQIAGVVIEPGQDLGVRPAGQPVVGEVGLPALVRQLGREPQVGRPGRLRGSGVTSPARAR